MDKFSKDYLHTLNTFKVLRKQMIEIGLGSCREIDELGRKLLDHGADTYRAAVSTDEIETK